MSPPGHQEVLSEDLSGGELSCDLRKNRALDLDLSKCLLTSSPPAAAGAGHAARAPLGLDCFVWGLISKAIGLDSPMQEYSLSDPPTRPPGQILPA